MARYFIQLAYNGSNYHGWQVQPNGITVQEVLERSLSECIGHEVKITGAGRTDTSVHASFFIAHFNMDETGDYAGLRFLKKLNTIVKDNISIHRIFRVNDEAHARFSAVKRTYTYFISREKLPMFHNNSWYYNIELNIELMNRFCDTLKGEHDFTSFSKLHTQVSSNICHVYEASWEMNNGLLVFRISANRFLRDMVRSIVGTLTDLGRGRITPDEFNSIFEARNRNEASMSVPAHGLFLSGIDYPAWVYEYGSISS